MFRVSGPVRTSASACRGEATHSMPKRWRSKFTFAERVQLELAAVAAARRDLTELAASGRTASRERGESRRASVRAAPSSTTRSVARRGAHPRLGRERDLRLGTGRRRTRCRRRSARDRCETGRGVIAPRRAGVDAGVAALGAARARRDRGSPRKPFGIAPAQVGDVLAALRDHRTRSDLNIVRDRSRSRRDRSSCCRSGSRRSRCSRTASARPIQFRSDGSCTL